MVGRLSLFTLLLLLCTVVLAQPGGGVRVTSSLSETTVSLDRTVTLTVAVTGAADGVDVPLPETRDGGLRFMPAGRRYQMTTVNGEVSSSTQYDFVVMPLKTGRHLVEPMNITVNGTSYTTPSQRLEVTDMAAASQHSAYPSQSQPSWGPGATWPGMPPQPREDDVLLESRVEPEVVYKHQPVIYKLTLLTAVRLLSDPRYSAIAPTGFLRVPYEQVNSAEERGGRPYDTSSITTAFFPLNEGDYTFPATQIQVTPGDLSMPRLLRTQPHAIKVLPLPAAGRPKSFTGAVGTRFDLDVRLKSDTITLGSSAELQVKVEGDGHLDLVPYPYLPAWDGLEKKLGKTPSETSADDGKVHSTRTYNYRLKPSKEGTFELSGMAFAFFNPEEKRYETVLAPTLILQVEANPNAVKDDAAAGGQELSESELPAEAAGPASAQSHSAPYGATAAGIALLLAGTLLGRKGAFFNLSLRRRSSPKIGSHTDFKGFLATLDRLAPGQDRPSRIAALTESGWTVERAEQMEALRQRANRAQFGGSSDEKDPLAALDDELSRLLKERAR